MTSSWDVSRRIVVLPKRIITLVAASWSLKSMTSKFCSFYTVHFADPAHKRYGGLLWGLKYSGVPWLLVRVRVSASSCNSSSLFGTTCGCAKVVRTPKPLSMFLWRHSWQFLRQNHRACVCDVTDHNNTLPNLLDRSGLRPDLFWGGIWRCPHYLRSQ